MIKVTKGSTGEAKKELQVFLKVKNQELRDYKKKYPAKERKSEHLRKIEEMGRFLYMFRVSVMLPAYLNGVLINLISFEKALKKLADFKVSIDIFNDKLVLHYIRGKEVGVIEFYDLQIFLPSTNFPIIEVEF